MTAFSGHHVPVLQMEVLSNPGGPLSQGLEPQPPLALGRCILSTTCMGG